MRRRGVTLAELMLAIAIAAVLGAFCQDLLMRADRIFDSARKHADLGVSTRALIENMVRDVAAAQQFLPADAAGELALVRAADDDVRERLKLNADWAYPFLKSDSGTEQQQPCVRVRYTFDPTRRTVTRRAERGVLICRASLAQLESFDFKGDSDPADERVLAESVSEFSVKLLGRNEEREMVVAGGTRTGALPVWKAQLALVNVVALHDEGLYAKGGDRAAPRVAMTVPLWSVKRRSDAVYPEYFSSTDEDLTW